MSDWDVVPTGGRVKIDGVWYRIYKRYWTEVDLMQLEDGELIRWGDGKTYHELLTPIKVEIKK